MLTSLLNACTHKLITRESSIFYSMKSLIMDRIIQSSKNQIAPKGGACAYFGKMEALVGNSSET